ncbi:sugar transferase [Pseudoalteromonas sp. OANN1]|uniref:sugar transferase n=1 Tax=Pseudoalteromonas sp. OANN1 TaxID=2954497 RepID=UPI00209681A2|nr:sugar transferase [Pseudoalteromonas sp. OANN1]MCO7198261.1 sugar transferase [Pseudoalteromonas sp. OANN1]
MLKRLFDLFSSFLGLLLLGPLLVLIAFWIKIGSKGPIFFRQERVGLNGRIFRIHKFRSMRVDSESSGRLTVGADSRITKEGAVLRKLKLDELPQLIDVLIGNMSLVGPRPEVPEFIDCYPEEVRARILSVKPGITDRASIEMIDENEILSKYDDAKKAYIEVILPKKQYYYLDYVGNHSVLGDVKIILDTVKKIVKR